MHESEKFKNLTSTQSAQQMSHRDNEGDRVRAVARICFVRHNYFNRVESKLETSFKKMQSGNVQEEITRQNVGEECNQY